MNMENIFASYLWVEKPRTNNIEIWRKKYFPLNILVLKKHACKCMYPKSTCDTENLTLAFKKVVAHFRKSALCIYCACCDRLCQTLFLCRTHSTELIFRWTYAIFFSCEHKTVDSTKPSRICNISRILWWVRIHPCHFWMLELRYLILTCGVNVL